MISEADLTDEQFLFLKTLIYNQFGIEVTPAKRMMAIGRLLRLMREYDEDSVERFIDQRLRHLDAELLGRMANHFSTNHTFFWREQRHFELFWREYLPQRIATQRGMRDRDIRTWCAASSTGEEPYTLAAILQNALGADAGQWTSRVLATDISERALDIARRGEYNTSDVDNLPGPLRAGMFEKAGEGLCRVRAPMRDQVAFRRFNLLSALPFKRPFHFIFCRNVMIYFDEPTKRDLVERMYQHTEPGGYLFTGLAESVHGTRYKRILPGVYRRL